MLGRVARAVLQSTTRYSAARSRTIHSRGTATTYGNYLYATRTRTPLSIDYVGVPRTSVARFHTSPRRQAPPFLVLLLTPIGRFFAAVGGRLTRLWWRRLSPERKLAIKASIARRKNYIYGGLGLLTLGGFGYYYSHIEETPLTGRRRFVMFSQDDVIAMVQAEKNDFLKLICEDERNVLSFDHPAYKRVQSIVSNILASNKSPEFEGFEWSLYVVDKPDHVNALCLPTGDIFVYTGLINQCKCDEELAFILSHEMAHAVLRHGVEALSRNGVASFLSLFIIALIWAVIPNDLVSYFLHGFSRSTVQVMLEHPHSRKLEMEADKVHIHAVHTSCKSPITS